MAEYKKKNIKKIKLNKIAPAVKKSKPEKPSKPVKVEMAHTKPTVNKKPVGKPVNNTTVNEKPIKKKVSKKETNFVSYNVIIGNKAKNAAKKLKKFIGIAVVATVIIIISLMTPTGLTEYIQNAILSIGSADFPKELTGSQTVSSEYRNNKLYVITDMAYNVYNSKGKTILSDTHGFSNPFMKVSSARTLVLDQNGVGYKIYNLNNAVVDLTSKNNLITGDIARNGTYAIVSKPPDYASNVEVYSKSNKLLFSWSSSKEIITAVCLSNNGKKIAVSTIYSDAGEYNSKVYVFNYKNAEPLLKLEYNLPVLYLKTLNGSSFASVTNSKIDFVNWRNQKVTSIENEGNIINFRHISNSQFLVSCESSMNNLETHCTLYNSRFEAVQNVLFSGSAEDVSYSGGKFICFDDNTAYALDESGKTVYSAECGYSVRHIFAKKSDTLFAVSDTEVRKIVMEDRT